MAIGGGDYVNNSKHFMNRDKEYKVFSVRLSDNNIKDLKNLVEKESSWNMLFNKILNKFKNK